MGGEGSHGDERDGRQNDAPQKVTTEEQTVGSETSQLKNYEQANAVTLSEEEGEWTV